MPTYEYECRTCGHKFDHFQSMRDKPLTKCPQCKGKINRLISGGAGVIFRGSGFYQTDYRSAGYKSDAKKETTSAPAPEPAKAAKVESKP
jgi:putative FmdB family regulatory protein